MMLKETVGAGEIIPRFALPEVDGGRVSSSSYRGKRNLVVFLIGTVSCPDCLEQLKDITAAYTELQSEQAELIVILKYGREVASTFKDAVGLKSPVLYDEKEDVFRRIGAVDEKGSLLSAIIITDRFGEVYYNSLAGAGVELPSVKEIIDWLEFIEVQCPE